MKFPKPVKREKARKPLQRFARLKAKGNTAHSRRERAFPYIRAVKLLPCIARLLEPTGNGCEGLIEADHIGGRYGVNSDLRCVPMCRKHHRERTGIVGGGGVFAGWTVARRREWGAWAVGETQRMVFGRPA